MLVMQPVWINSDSVVHHDRCGRRAKRSEARRREVWAPASTNILSGRAISQLWQGY